MMKALLNLLNLNGYRSLICKFTDKSTITDTQHDWVADNWREVFHETLRRGQIRFAWNIRKYWKLNDWDSMFEMLLEYYKVEVLPE